MDGKKEVVVGAVQFPCSQNISDNINTAERLVREAHAKGVNIVLLQELFEHVYFCQTENQDYFDLAKPYQGHPTIERMRILAKELGVVIPVTFYEEANNVNYLSVAVIDADGTDLGLYRKSHIPYVPGHYEKYYFTPGDSGFKVFETRFARIGVAICWDQWFPEVSRAMVLEGAEILFYPIGNGDYYENPNDFNPLAPTFPNPWVRSIQGQAADNYMPIVVANRVGIEKIFNEKGETKTLINYVGGSFIAGENGEVIEPASSTDEDIIIASFDLNQIKKGRLAWGWFRDRRPEMYQVLLKNE